MQRGRTSFAWSWKAICAALSVNSREEIVKQPEMVGDQVRSTCATELSKMGLEVVSFTIKEVRDQNDYIRQHGPP